MIARILGATAPAKDVYDYLWHGRAAADPLGVRTAYVRDYFARMLDTSGLDVPAGTLDPFITARAGSRYCPGTCRQAAYRTR